MFLLAETMSDALPADYHGKILQCQHVNDGIAFKYFKMMMTMRGRLLNQNYKAKGTNFKLCDLLYVDDRAFFFTTKEALQGGSEIIKEHFETFGLKMHWPEWK
jgi:hypothetical protein